MAEDLIITPEPPYDMWEVGVVHQPRFRRVVSFYGRKEDVPDNEKVPSITSYARYLYQVWLWKEKGEWIPDGYDVDHINDDPLDDRLENLQLLTNIENIRKRDHARYKKVEVSAEELARVEKLLNEERSWHEIASICRYQRGFLRYLIATHLPHHALEEHPRTNAATVQKMLDNGCSQDAVAEYFGVDQATISRFIDKHLPKYSKARLTEARVALIRDLLARGETLTNIAKATDCTVGNIIYFLKTYEPKLYEFWRKQKQYERQRMVEKVKELLEQGKTQREIAKILNTSRAIVTNIVTQIYPEYTADNLYLLRVEAVKEALRDGCTLPEAAKRTGLRYLVVYTITERFFPEYLEKTRAKREEHHRQIGQWLAEGKSQKEIAQLTGKTQGSVSEYISKHYPQHTRAAKKAETV